MANKHLTLTQVGNVLATVSYVIETRGDRLDPTELYEITGDLEQSIVGIMYAALRRRDERNAMTPEQQA